MKRRIGGVTKGAVIVEASFVLVVFFIIAIGYIEASRYIAARNLLSQSADIALKMAQQIGDLENQDNQASIENQAVKIATVALVSKPDKPSSATLIAPSSTTYKILNLPQAPPGQLENKLQTVPIRIELRASLSPIFPFLPPIKVTSKAVGFREPRRVASEPVPKDCAGNVLGSPGYYAPLTCGCPNMQCGLRMRVGQLVWQGPCMCMCNEVVGYISDGAGGCVCETGKTERDGICVPDSNACPPSQRYVGTECACASGSTKSGDSCTCSDPKKVYDNASYSCVCRPPPWGSVITDPNTCASTCADPHRETSSEGCSTCKSGYIDQPPSGPCICPNDPSIGGPACPAGSQFNSNTCSCLCSDPCYDAYGTARNYPPDSSNSCSSCPACGAGEITNGRRCQCDSSTCTVPGQVGVPTPGGCMCACPGGTQEYNGHCLQPNCITIIQVGCPSGVNYDAGGGCSCDE